MVIIMLLEKYEPKALNQILGNQRQALEIVKWLASWKKGRALLIYGPTGSGKSIAVRLAANQSGFEIMESHAGEERGKSDIEEIINASKQQGIFSRKKIILVEDISVIESKKTLAALASESLCPIVFVADSYDPSLAKYCKQIRFQKIDNATMLRFLKYVCGREGIDIGDSILDNIVKSCNGDVRASLMDLDIAREAGKKFQTVRRDQARTIFEIAKLIFNNEKDEARKLAEQQPDTLMLLVASNILQEHRDIESIAYAYDSLSKADLFRSRIIKRQSWGLQKYLIDLMIYGMPRKRRVTLASYQPPAKEKLNPATLEKIANKFHISKKGAARYMGVISLFIDNNEFIKEMDFDEGDIQFIKAVSSL